MTYMDPRPEGLNTEKAPESIVEKLVTPYALIKELTDDLESELMDRYRGYPEDDRRFVRDMRTVKEARAWLAQQQPGWMPIETAPMDGTHVLTWNGRWIAVSYWSAKDFYNAPAWHDTRSHINSIDQPTHWMPLPAAPNDEVKNG